MIYHQNMVLANIEILALNMINMKKMITLIQHMVIKLEKA